MTNKFNKLTIRATALLIALVALSIFILAGVSYTKLYEVTETNASIRIDRASRAAASIFSLSLDGDFTVVRDAVGRPSGIQIASDDPERALSFRPEHDAVLSEIGVTNQGAANLFKFNAEANGFDRFATTFRTPDGSVPPPMSITQSHPAFADLIANRPHIGEVPVQNRMRLAYLTPIQARDGSVAGALAVDVGFVDDLLIARDELQFLIAGSAIAILALAAFLGACLMTREMRPLKELAQFANDLAGDRNAGRVPYANRNDEIGALAQGMSRVVEFQQDLARLAYADELTGLGNRSRYLADLERVTSSCRNGGQEWTLLHVNIDRFKDSNVAFGQAGGDALLKQFGAALVEVAGEGSHVSRLSGDQFTVLVPRQAGDRTHSEVYGNLLLRLGKPFMLGQTEVHLGASIGVVRLPDDAQNAEEAHLNADLAVRKARADGGSRCAVFASEMYMVVQSQIELERMLRDAIKERSITVNYQPQINPADNSLAGLEALARWPHQDRGMISPAEFIPVAESTGQIVELGNLVLDEACRQARRWLDEGFEFKRISVNISPIQLWQPTFERTIRNALERHGIAGHHICLEVTESLFVDQDEGRVSRILGKLKALGVFISLDDFGSGYSSLGYLNRLPFDQMKVDRSFVLNVDRDVRNQKLLTGIVSLADGLGLNLVVEGVETREVVDYVSSLGCTTIQGYFYSKPLAAAEIISAVRAISLLGSPDADAVAV